MTRNLFTNVIGAIYALIGILGFVPQAMTDGKLLGLFPVNQVHSIIHLLVGLLGLGAARGMGLSTRLYCQVIGVVFVVLGLLGFVMPEVPAMGNIGPLDTYLHLATGLAGLYYGFMDKS